MADKKLFDKHIFLTGKIQVGKSTILREIIDACPDLRLGGFFTKWIGPGPYNKAGLYMFPADRKILFEVQKFLDADEDAEDEDDIIDIDPRLLKADNLLAEFSPDNYKKKLIHTESFDRWGKKLPRLVKESDLILFDEIGIFEDHSTVFIDSVKKILEGDTQVIGIVSIKKGKATYIIENHPNVEIIEVTTENRETVLKDLLKRIRIS